MMWLSQSYQPSYRTINRFRVNPLVNTLLRECFVQFPSQLAKEQLIEEEAIFIDGTKIEANYKCHFYGVKHEHMKNGQLKASYNLQIARPFNTF
ncbi:hypothetical protein BCR21_08885 [Enterococcus ureasiticus]|uniref:Transposase DDE domain-containing protein n=1 Tax=Enterococcus ureasiticus TaxID=903984 RepID=A0A1E5GFA3_9ENTE|nr:hypothetical protein BCR21_08885 [Enterococcus ureasiticus]